MPNFYRSNKESKYCKQSWHSQFLTISKASRIHNFTFHMFTHVFLNFNKWNKENDIMNEEECLIDYGNFGNCPNNVKPGL